MFLISNINTIAYKIHHQNRQDKTCVRLFQLHQIKWKIMLAPRAGYKHLYTTKKKM